MKKLWFLLVLLLLPISLGTAEIEKWQRAPADITVGVLPLQWVYNGNCYTTPELVKQLAEEGEKGQMSQQDSLLQQFIRSGESVSYAVSNNIILVVGKMNRKER